MPGFRVSDETALRVTIHKGEIRLQNPILAPIGGILFAGLAAFGASKTIDNKWVAPLFAIPFLMQAINAGLPLMKYNLSREIVTINYGSFIRWNREYRGVPEFAVEPGTTSKGQKIFTLNILIGGWSIQLAKAAVRQSLDRLAEELANKISGTQPQSA
jgi:hypothetical protein